MTRKMILIHGAWLSSSSWGPFQQYFSEIGYDVSAPEWPRKSLGVTAQREESEALHGLGVEEIVEHYEAIILELEEPPVLVGHSFGGLFVELLLDRGLGVAGVALDPAPGAGVLRLLPSELKAGSPALSHPLHKNGAVALTFEQFHYAFTNTWTEEAAREAYEAYAVPETARILFEGASANFKIHPSTKINYKNGDRAPLLITAGEKDNTVPASVSRETFHHYRHSPAVTDFREFEGRSHLLIAGDGWEEVASFVSDWLERVLATEPAASIGR